MLRRGAFLHRNSLNMRFVMLVRYFTYFSIFALTLPFISISLSHSRAGEHAHGHGAANDSVPVGFHEFELVGERSIYLSHYPMFGSIHSYQVIFEASFS